MLRSVHLPKLLSLPMAIPALALALSLLPAPPWTGIALAFNPPRYEACTEARTPDAAAYYCYLFASHSMCSFARTLEMMDRCAHATTLAAPGMIAQGKAEQMINIIASKSPLDPLLKAELREVEGDVHLALDDPHSALFYYQEARELYADAAPARLDTKIAQAQALAETR